ncbi:MAG TPA: hypothetical protein VEW28_03005 [Candidatus Kapabacteria bacterium]|nr:hypothetical protein [Candidatus Kapabacteria bacterium]
MNPTFHIILRTCDIVHSLHNAPRPFNLDKRTLIKICFRSIVEALDGIPHTITVVADRLSDEMTKFFEQYDVTMIHGEFGNDASLRKCMEVALTLPDDDWVYFVEDDYLHTPEAFKWVNDFVVNHKKYIPQKNLITRYIKFIKRSIDKHPIIIHPPDYIDRYLPRYLSYSLMFVSKYCHWRQINYTTFTIMMQVSTFKRYQKIIFYTSYGADDGYLSRALYGGIYFGDRALAISPIPGVATHMHSDVMTPLVDWESIVARYSAP